MDETTARREGSQKFAITSVEQLLSGYKLAVLPGTDTRKIVDEAKRMILEEGGLTESDRISMGFYKEGENPEVSI